jgi:hypothetical protein
MGDLRRDVPNGGEPLWTGPKDLLLFFPGRGRPNKGVKQAAPGNYRTRCFAQRTVQKSSSA